MPELGTWVTLLPEKTRGFAKGSKAQRENAQSTPAMVSWVFPDGTVSVIYPNNLVLQCGFKGDPFKHVKDVPVERLRRYSGSEVAMQLLEKAMKKAVKAEALARSPKKLKRQGSNASARSLTRSDSCCSEPSTTKNDAACASPDRGNSSKLETPPHTPEHAQFRTLPRTPRPEDSQQVPAVANSPQLASGSQSLSPRTPETSSSSSRGVPSPSELLWSPKWTPDRVRSRSPRRFDTMNQILGIQLEGLGLSPWTPEGAQATDAFGLSHDTPEKKMQPEPFEVQEHKPVVDRKPVEEEPASKPLTMKATLSPKSQRRRRTEMTTLVSRTILGRGRSCDQIAHTELEKALHDGGFDDDEVVSGLQRLEDTNKILMMDGIVFLVC